MEERVLAGTGFEVEYRRVPFNEIREYNFMDYTLKHERNGKHFTLGLFRELAVNSGDGDKAIFTTQPFDIYDLNNNYFFSFKRLYLEYLDPTEYKQALGIVGTWRHWKLLKRTNKLKDLFEECEEELDIKMKSLAIESLKKVAVVGDAKGVAAAKYLANLEYKGSTRGRPSKAEKEGNLKKELEDTIDFKKDLERMGIVLQ